MFKKTITYKDYHESERTEDFYFHLTRAELLEMEMTTPGGYKEMLERIIKAQDVPTLYKTFKEFIHAAYGEKSADGKRFRKIDEQTGRRLVEAFAETEAYSILLTEVCTNSDAAAKFINGIIDGANSSNRTNVAPAQAVN